MTSEHHERPEGRAPQIRLTDRSVGIAFSVVFAIIGLVPLLRGGAIRPAALACAGGFALLAWRMPRVLRPLTWAWTRVAVLANAVNTFVLMAITFYVAVTPIATMRRFLGRDVLKLRWEPDRESYWIARPVGRSSPDSMKEQF